MSKKTPESFRVAAIETDGHLRRAIYFVLTCGLLFLVTAAVLIVLAHCFGFPPFPVPFRMPKLTRG